MRKEMICMVVMLTLIAGGCQTQGDKPDEWGHLRNLWPNIKSEWTDENITFTQDGKTMYFASKRKGEKVVSTSSIMHNVHI